MIVYRLCNTKYANDISGEGARRQTSNRWNSLGTPMLYTCESTALCAVELHQYIPPAFHPKNYVLLKIEIPKNDVLTIDKTFFINENWIDNKHITQSIGDQFVNENKFLVMKVPSAMVTACFNFLINPNHKDLKKVKIINTIEFPIKGKLFKK